MFGIGLRQRKCALCSAKGFAEGIELDRKFRNKILEARRRYPFVAPVEANSNDNTGKQLAETERVRKNDMRKNHGIEIEISSDDTAKF